MLDVRRTRVLVIPIVGVYEQGHLVNEVQGVQQTAYYPIEDSVALVLHNAEQEVLATLARGGAPARIANGRDTIYPDIQERNGQTELDAADEVLTVAEG